MNKNTGTNQCCVLKPDENMLPLELQIESHLILTLVAKWKQFPQSRTNVSGRKTGLSVTKWTPCDFATNMNLLQKERCKEEKET